MIHGPRQAYCLKRLQRLQRAVEAKTCHLQSQLPVTLTEHLEPEPDGAVIHGKIEDYIERHPGPQDIVAVVEISDSSLEYDRTTKQRVYATAFVPVYWIVNIPEHQIEVYELPDADSGLYGRRTNYRTGDMISLSISPNDSISIGTAELLPT
jgi:Uma2 family endonuclease